MATKKKKTKAGPKAKKKVVAPKKKAVVAKKPKGKLIGKVEHYYDKIGVMAMRLKDVLKKGDTIRVEGGGKSFKQKIASMQIDHEAVTSAKKGSDVGIKVSKKAREGYRVFKEA
ncbi:MAG: hypothetical protein HYW97_01530 [Candidatus Wildermuthbacteria bacterium]|nr:hypothetical protein [Candidatus Wildermuthbacteria bacterium]